MCGFLRRLVETELVDEWRVLAAPVAEDVPGDLRRASDEELETPDVRVVVVPRRRREEDGAPPQSKAPEPHDRRARFPVVRLQVDKILNLRAKIAAASESSSSDSGSDWD